MVLRIPARSVAGDQQMESVTNVNSREEQVMRIGGTFGIPPITGTISTATGTVTATDVSHAGTLLVMIYGTYAGVNLTFEALNSAGGNSTWTPIAGARVDTGVIQTTTGVLPSNTVQAWRFPIGRVNQFRVRATAWTSGTVNVIVDPAVPWGEPIVSAIASKPAGAVPFTLSTIAAGVAPTASDAPMSLVPTRNLVNGTAGTSHPLTAGKTFKVVSMSIVVSASTTTNVRVVAFLRFNSGGVITNTSPIVAQVGAGTAAAIAANTGQNTVPVDQDLPAGLTPGQVGVSIIGSTATGLCWVSVQGYEI